MCPIFSRSDFLSWPEWGWLSGSLPGLDRGSDALAERLVSLLTNWLFNHSFILGAYFKCVAIRNYFFSLLPLSPARLLEFLSVNHCLFFCLCPPLREMMIHAASCSTKDDLQYGEMSEVCAQTPPPFTFLSPRLPLWHVTSLFCVAQGEKIIFEYFSDPEFIVQLLEFLSLEDRKGKDSFNPRRFCLFKVLWFTRLCIWPGSGSKLWYISTDLNVLISSNIEPWLTWRKLISASASWQLNLTKVATFYNLWTGNKV